MRASALQLTVEAQQERVVGTEGNGCNRQRQAGEAAAKVGADEGDDGARGGHNDKVAVCGGDGGYLGA